MKKIALFFCFLIIQINAQTGISVSPPRVYFETTSGSSSTQKITVTNVSVKHTLDLAVSLGDWEYDEKGENIMQPSNTLKNSCTQWISINKEDSYFSLAPGERKDLNVTLTVPSVSKDQLAAHTAVLFVSQMNPVDGTDNTGAKIKVSVKSGIKIFHKKPETSLRKIEIKDLKFDTAKKVINLQFENQSELWTDGKITTDLINTTTGKKVTVDPVVFYTLPGNIRKLSIPVQDLKEKGSYNLSVLIDNGDDNTLEMAELNFNYE
ncbi:fimbrial biogenesis chaperone [Chryseobacterium luquanense]|uniref:Molecular chaperone n=1 Tax=Chryseobacterium luquanense TaxID=2983766 RepID=A0ABT3Y7F1_9FLAO|nr:molecular chaperone [Chryseobacterium luquanense]MCX8534085.1 molecular chaperone [Chryseobacterium luquanense]